MTYFYNNYINTQINVRVQHYFTVSFFSKINITPHKNFTRGPGVWERIFRPWAIWLKEMRKVRHIHYWKKTSQNKLVKELQMFTTNIFLSIKWAKADWGCKHSSRKYPYIPIIYWWLKIGGGVISSKKIYIEEWEDIGILQINLWVFIRVNHAVVMRFFCEMTLFWNNSVYSVPALNSTLIHKHNFNVILRGRSHFSSIR